MPELPEVESFTRYFARHALRKPIARVRVLDDRILGRTRKAAFVRGLNGRSFRAVRRHGKHLFADAGDTWLHLHFGMSGDLSFYTDAAQPRFARIVFDFTDGSHLAFEDMRLFGLAELSAEPETFIRESGLGPDPIEIGLREFRARLRTRRAAIKAVLLSQDVIAGVGNLYADETLFRSGIDPRRHTDALSSGEVKTIFTNLRRVLDDALASRSRGFMVEERDESAPCPRCGGVIARTVAGGRTTYYCSSHQR